MSSVVQGPSDRKLSIPFFLLVLSLLALLVSLMGLARTASVTSDRMNDLQMAWQDVQEGSVEGSELVLTDRLMARLRLPVPAMRNAAYWSLGLAALSAVLFAWLVMSQRRAAQQRNAQSPPLEDHEQAAMQRLLDEIAPLASGDLRVRATVTDSVTGSLADAFNYAISELRWLTGTMGHAATQMSEVVERSRSSAEAVSRTGAEQSEQTLSSSNSLSTLGSAMADIAADAADTSATANASLVQAEEGAASLASCLERLSAVRNEAEVTTRLMHRLVENVAAINTQVDSIREVARRTDLLALNTTIRASAGAQAASPANAAADLGRLSDEVAQLAEVLGRATRDIESLTTTIMQDAEDTVQAMEFTGEELTAGVQRTEQATTALQRIREGAATLQQRAALMAERTTEQTSMVRSLSTNMDSINRLTQQTGAAVLENSESLNQLEELAGELRQGLGDFQLPPRPDPQSQHSGKQQRDQETGLRQDADDRTVIHG